MTGEDMPKGTKWSNLIKEYNLTSLIGKLLVPGMSQNDVILECVILAGQMCVDEKSSTMIASSSLIRALHELWQDKGDDSEIVLQLLTAFHKMLHFSETREELLYSTEAMADISDCVGSKHRATRAVADKCLDMILEIDRNEDGELGELGAQVRKRRYLAHITRNGLKLFVLTAELTEFTVILQETAVMIQTSWGVTLKINSK